MMINAKHMPWLGRAWRLRCGVAKPSSSYDGEYLYGDSAEDVTRECSFRYYAGSGTCLACKSKPERID